MHTNDHRQIVYNLIFSVRNFKIFQIFEKLSTEKKKIQKAGEKVKNLFLSKFNVKYIQMIAI